MPRNLYLGIDPSASAARDSGYCVINDSQRIISIGKWRGFEELAHILEPFKQQICIVGIDGPLQPPHELHRCCFTSEECHHEQNNSAPGRICERLLIRRGYRCFLTSKNSFVKSWVLRCFDLKDFLSDLSCQIIEVFPYATRKILFPDLHGKKQTREFRLNLQKHLKDRGIRLPEKEKPYSHDELDALLAAVTARLVDLRQAERIGDERDGYIYIPLKISEDIITPL
ncbi:MAG: DUF429 domain-containing protein [Calditrichaeota bacterium]|nr:DUF429 domain-containing protein [Calditrichota bacterium]RQV92487.1 MAG: DUF429 domain-containing protein [bacterium]RQV99184.1 MAG: DUF429 domain-containing protein [Calditrichota bacterium]